ncbi:hypothetical protein B566_EDAN001294 [Ephemera danica]|nr:hypothetical protein B566_EDAN001294 [Ephemera danica]
MPFDFRRIQGPEDSESYHQFVKTGKKVKTKLLDNSGVRADQRNANAMRKIYLKTGVVSQAKGSAYLEMGDTKILCSVFDPREKPRGAEHNLRGDIYCEFKFASFSSRRRKSHMLDTEDKEYIDVHILVIQDDGSTLAAAITCAGLALADAAVPMYDLVVGTTKAICGSSEVMDPTAKEETCALQGLAPGEDHGVATIALLPTFSQVAQLVHVGDIDPARLETCLSQLVTAGSDVHQAVQLTLTSAVKHQLKLQKNVQDKEITDNGCT